MDTSTCLRLSFAAVILSAWLQSVGYATDSVSQSARSKKTDSQSAERPDLKVKAVSAAVPGQVTLLLTQGKTFLGGNRLGPAVACFTKALAICPDLTQALLSRGVAHFGLGEEELAISDYDRVLQLEPGNEECYVHRAECYSVIGALDKAQADIKKSLQINPKSEKAREVLGTIYGSKGDYINSIKTYSEVIELTSDKKYKLKIIKKRAATYSALKDYKSSLADYLLCLKLKPDDIDSKVYIAVLYERTNQFAEEARTYSELIDLRPKHGDYYLGRAKANFKCHRYAESLLDANKLIAWNPHDDELYYLRAQIYYGMKNYSGALSDANCCINTEDGARKRSYELRAQIYDHLGNLEAASADRERAKTLIP